MKFSSVSALSALLLPLAAAKKGGPPVDSKKLQKHITEKGLVFEFNTQELMGHPLT
jgi:hypothetical protein